jgi:hypothetical protein
MQFKRNVTDQGDMRLKERTCSTGSIGVRKYKIHVMKNLFFSSCFWTIVIKYT